MKHLKKMMALVIAMAMVLGMMSMSAFAADTGSITINNAGNISSKHSYEAYQVFSGNLSADGTTLSDIQWGSGVDGDALLTALKAENAYAECTSAADVAKVLEGFDDDSAQLIAFNAIVAENLKESGKKTGNSTDGITGLAYGYWFVKDVTTMPADGTDALSAYILQVIGQAELNIKADAPEIEKKIVEGTDRVDSNNVAIGDTVTYEIKTAVPDMTYFNDYYFLVSDTLSKGLTYTDGSLAVTIGGSEYAASKYDLTVGNYSKTNGTAISIDFKDLYEDFKAETPLVATGDEILITYDVVLNEDAVIGSTGNPNTVKLIYTNDATWNGEGSPDDDDFPKGETPDDTVITYVTEIEITKKVDGSSETLEGAVFQITGNTLNKVIITGEVFKEDTSGKYYKLKDGSYTTTTPTDKNKDSYKDTTTKYAMTTEETISATEGQTVVYEGVSDASGLVKFTGLPAGTYTITEIAAPSGYNKLSGPITVTIDWTKPEKADDPGIADGTETCTWEFTTTGAVETAKTEATDGKIAFDVENAAGAVLPTTGGIGTTIFYVIGSLLVIGAGVVLVTRKRMGTE